MFTTSQLVAGVRLAQAFIGTKSMRAIGAKLKKLPHPKCKEYKYDSDFFLAVLYSRKYVDYVSSSWNM